METVVSIFKISGAVTALIALIALALHLIFNKRSFFRLYRRGYIVTHPGHKAVMFKKLTDARSFIKRSARHGNDCNIVEAYAPVGVLIRITNFKNIYKMKKENTVHETIKPMEYDALLSTGLVRTLVEATGRFEFVEETAHEIVFFDNHWEQDKAIGTKWTLKQIMGWITNYYAEDYQWQGEEKAKRKIRRALGIDD